MPVAANITEVTGSPAQGPQGHTLKGDMYMIGRLATYKDTHLPTQDCCGIYCPHQVSDQCGQSETSGPHLDPCLSQILPTTHTSVTLEATLLIIVHFNYIYLCVSVCSHAHTHVDSKDSLSGLSFYLPGSRIEHRVERLVASILTP